MCYYIKKSFNQASFSQILILQILAFGKAINNLEII